MKIFELFNPEKIKKEDFDLKDDLIFYMNNQPEFYRKHYFPTMCRFKECYDKNIKVNPAAFGKLVEKAYKMYYQEFPVKDLNENLGKDIFEEICAEIHSMELENVKKGQYNIK
jgi:hypothetical protein